MREITGIYDRDIMYSDVKDMTELDLYCYNTGEVFQIMDISALGEMTNLTSLNLGGNQISDISVLSNLVNLTYLELRSNPISDISPLSNLTNLQYLSLQINSGIDESFIRHVPDVAWYN